MNFLALFALSLAPGLAIGLYIYLKDKHEREPVHLLLLSFLFGTLSTLITFLISKPLNEWFPMRAADVLDQFYNAFFITALVEEFSKFLFVRFVLYYNKNFNEPFDGIVYAVMVSMGFATLENIMYVFNQGFLTGFLRLFTAVPAHATFAVIMGYFLGKAKFTHRRELYYSVIALGTATFFHGIYDYFWFIAYVPGIWIGAVAALSVGFFLSRKAIHLHQIASPFIGLEKEEFSKPIEEFNQPEDISSDSL